MSHLSRTNGRPEPEVIVNFADGFAYSKGKMEEAFRTGLLDRPVAKVTKESSGAKREDVDLLMHELEIPRAYAEKLLVESSGSVTKAFERWIAA
ncbi:hypothetical protein B0H21DRAFT_716045 [Amylocystis lapponica]|nr:hypothetical protein B0H21DRAFT_716045 [Amylocystis lapponica]